MLASIASQPNLRFYDLNGQRELSDVVDLIDHAFLQNIRPEQFEQNTRHGLLNREQWGPVLGSLLALYSGMQWNAEQGCALDPAYRPNLLPATLDTLHSAVESFLEQQDAESVAVHLSGGFDSTLIIGILNHLQIPVTLIGMSSERYEFRTERHIQNILAEKANGRAHLIDYEENLPHSGLRKTPPSQHPDMESGDSSDHAIAEKCQELGIDLILSGEGGDILLGSAVPEDPALIDWKLQILAQDSITDLVYAPRGVRLESFYRDKGIADAIYSLRRGQKEDCAKRWAREYFRAFIPPELADYGYCADFWGLYIDGLHAALPVIHEIHEEAHEISQHPYFDKRCLEELLKQDLLRCDQRFYQKLESRVALAAWLCSVHSAISPR